jgi:hypothetical protein
VGTDIHAMIEIEQRREGVPSWMVMLASVSLPRDYSLFGLLAGVRSDGTGVSALIPPRGLPRIMSVDAHDALELFVDDEMADGEWERACTRAKADAWVASGVTRYLDDARSRVFDPDVFAVTWLTAPEVAAVVDEYQQRWGTAPLEIAAALAAMRVCDAAGCAARLLLWFKG